MLPLKKRPKFVTPFVLSVAKETKQVYVQDSKEETKNILKKEAKNESCKDIQKCYTSLTVEFEQTNNASPQNTNETINKNIIQQKSESCCARKRSRETLHLDAEKFMSMKFSNNSDKESLSQLALIDESDNKNNGYKCKSKKIMLHINNKNNSNNTTTEFQKSLEELSLKSSNTFIETERSRYSPKDRITEYCTINSFENNCAPNTTSEKFQKSHNGVQSKYFRLIFTKRSNKKKKKWRFEPINFIKKLKNLCHLYIFSCGILQIKGQVWTIFDEDGKIITRSNQHQKEKSNLKIGDSLPMRNWEGEIEGEISKDEYETGRCFLSTTHSENYIQASSSVKVYTTLT